MIDKPTEAYPLQWPIGWKRTPSFQRSRAKFSKQRAVIGHESVEPGIPMYTSARVTIGEGTDRVLRVLNTMGFNKSVIVSSNLELRLDGLPRSGQREPQDPGVCVYWGHGEKARCMAVDRYDRVADNLAAIAATLEAMRAIERHGGAAILERAFTGFTALPAPVAWWQVLELPNPHPTRQEIEQAHRKLIMEHHPDRGGDVDKAAAINRARDQGLEAI